VTKPLSPKSARLAGHILLLSCCLALISVLAVSVSLLIFIGGNTTVFVVIIGYAALYAVVIPLVLRERRKIIAQAN
jgi:hypothetical protein